MINNILNGIKNIDWFPFLIMLQSQLEYNYQNCLDYFNIRLQKDEKIPFEYIKNIEDVAKSPKLKIKHRKIDFVEIEKTEFGREIIKFANLIINNFSSKDLIMFYNNLNELSIRNKNIIDRNHFLMELMKRFAFEFGLSQSASYSPFHNRIYIYKTDHELFLPHELFHMTSSFYDPEKDISYSGFSQYNNQNMIIGDGITEGYTEYMVEKYYGKEFVKESGVNYQVLRKITKQIELIIGKEKIEKLYLNADLKGLVDELSYYVGIDNAIEFIKSTDYLFDNINFNYKSKNKREELLKNLVFINYFVVVLGTQKAIKQLELKEILKEDLLDTIVKNIQFSINIKLDNQKYSSKLDSKEVANLILSILRLNNIEFINEEIKKKYKL